MYVQQTPDKQFVVIDEGEEIALFDTESEAEEFIELNMLDEDFNLFDDFDDEEDDFDSDWSS